MSKKSRSTDGKQILPDLSGIRSLKSHYALTKSAFITGLYFTFGFFWITLSELLLEYIFNEPIVLFNINIAKGLVYVTVTTAFIFAMIYPALRRIIAIKDKLQNANAKLAEAQMLAQSGSYEFDVLNNRFDLSEEGLRIFGIRREEFSGKLEEILRFVHPEDRSDVLGLNLQAVAENRTLDYECRVVRLDGEERVISVRVAPSADANGRSTRNLGTIQDITGRRKMETTLGKEREMARMYLEIAAVIFVIIGREGQVKLINRTGCDTLGLVKEEILGKSWIDHFVAPSNRENTRMLIEKIFAGGESGGMNESRIITAQGEERDILWRHVALRGDEGKIDGILKSGVDITNQKLISAALYESERSKAVLLSHLPGMAFQCDYDRNWTMRYLSEGCSDLTGYPPENLLNNQELSYFSIICPEFREDLQRDWAAALASDIPFKHEYEIVTASGARKWVLEMGQGLYDDHGAVKALEGIIIDINESKQHYNQIQYMYDHDNLTGLYNHQYYAGAMQRLDQGGSLPLGVILTDINGLRLVNDAFGHDTGDLIIQKTGEIIQSCCRQGDILARTGEDEFSILLPGTGPEEAYELLTSIKNELEKHNAALRDKTQIINLSIGYAVRTNLSTGMADLEREAEAFMSRRKLLEQKSHHNAMLTSIMATMYERSFETEEHAERIARLSGIIGKKMGLSQDILDGLRLFSMLHDIGKIGIHDRILKKPDKLTGEEWFEMRKHPEIGYRIAMSSPDFSTIADYILTHHEHWDGTGYPNGLRGEEIPLLSCILAVADAYDAMTEDRIYRKGISHRRAIEEIQNNAGTQFDPRIAQIFIDNFGSESGRCNTQ